MCLLTIIGSIILVNNAFQNCFNNLAILVGAGFPSTVAPKIMWDSGSQTAILYSPAEFYNTQIGTNMIKIYFN